MNESVNKSVTKMNENENLNENLNERLIKEEKEKRIFYEKQIKDAQVSLSVCLFACLSVCVCLSNDLCIN